MVAGGSVDSFALPPDGTRLAFIADGRVDGVKELWSVPATGGTPLLLHTMPATGDVDTLRIAPDSLSVFHRADALADAVQELFVVPLDGSGPARRLNAGLPSGADVENDFVALAAGRVVFRADQEEVNVLELFMAFPGTRGALQAPTPTRTVVR